MVKGCSHRQHSVVCKQTMAGPILLTVIALLSMHSGAKAGDARSPTYAERQTSRTYLGSYQAKELGTLDDLPAEIKTRLTAHLIDRLGPDYFDRLRLEGGQIVDFDELYRVHPQARHFRWKVFAYRIGFRISEPEKGIKEFNGYIELNSDGSVLKEIEFPAVARAPWKADFVSLASAIETAGRRGLVVAWAEIRYLPEADILTFDLREDFPRDLVAAKVRVITVNAHTGEVVSDNRHSVIR